MDFFSYNSLPSNDLFYAACRASFLETLDAMLHEFLPVSGPAGRDGGFMDSVPLMRGCAPQVQLELLFGVWSRLSSESAPQLTVKEQCVCACAVTELARLGTLERTRNLERVMSGPRLIQTMDPVWLAARVHTLHVILPFAPQLANLDVNANVPSEEFEVFRSAGGVPPESINAMTAELGRWRVSPNLLTKSHGLLTVDEQEILKTFFDEHPELLSET